MSRGSLAVLWKTDEWSLVSSNVLSPRIILMADRRLLVYPFPFHKLEGRHIIIANLHGDRFVRQASAT